MFPVKVKLGPSESIWVMDEGDFIPEQAGDVSTKGQVFEYQATTLTTNQVQ